LADQRFAEGERDNRAMLARDESILQNKSLAVHY
jgi:hypothetical protein